MDINGLLTEWGKTLTASEKNVELMKGSRESHQFWIGRVLSLRQCIEQFERVSQGKPRLLTQQEVREFDE